MPTTDPYRRLPSISLAILALTVLGVLGGIYLVRAQAMANQRVVHTIEVEVALTEVLESARGVDAAVRGYMSTQRNEMLEDFGSSVNEVSGKIERVRQLTADNPSQIRRIDNIKRLMARRTDIASRSIRLKREGREDEIRILSQSLPGRRLTAAIAAEIGAMKTAERKLLDGRVRRVQNAAWLLTLGLFAAVALILAVAIAMVIDSKRKYRVIEQARDEARLAANTAQGEIAAREQAESQLRQLYKMESIGQLTGGIAHDFNNMLAIVIGSLDLAERRIRSDPDRAMQSIEHAREGAQRAATLTARLLAFSRQQPLAPVPLDANRLVSGMSELLHRSLGEHIAVETVLAGGLWNTFADPGQLENALLNLAVNARDAMPEGGRLTIETGNGHLDEVYAASRQEVAAGQYVVVCVTDTGTGMTADVTERAFDPFFTTKDVGKGTGLGLSQVFGFVKQSGGHVAIYSEMGEGTTIKLYLPRYIGPAPAKPAEALAAEALPQGKAEEVILVVEDEQRVRHFAIDALRELGYSTISAANGEEGLEVIRQKPHLSLLLTDIVMPQMNGRKLADAALEIIPGLPVLYTTGYTRNAVVHNGMLDPGVSLLAKPFTIAQLALKVRAVIDGKGVNRDV
jgi:signal transduction histidine kinase/ActR/RegA family two-component response regulator